MELNVDRQLVQSMLAGDRPAFDRFFTHYFPRVFRFARPRLGGDPDAARDVVQCCLIKAVRSLAKFRGEAALFSWVCQICRHEISDYLRIHRRHNSNAVSIDSSQDSRRTCALLAAPEEPDPDCDVAAEEACRLTRSVLDAMPENYRNILHWKYLEECSVEQIAERLGVGYVAAQSLLARARESFRKVHCQAGKRGFAVIIPLAQPSVRSLAPLQQMLP